MSFLLLILLGVTVRAAHQRIVNERCEDVFIGGRIALRPPVGVDFGGARQHSGRALVGGELEVTGFRGVRGGCSRYCRQSTPITAAATAAAAGIMLLRIVFHLM
jgi:hypothetical protein